MPDLTPGAVFAGHRIEAVAGRGGVGVVYRATHLALDHLVALKVISRERANDPSWRARFMAESRAAVSIRHPNVIGVRHAGEEDGLLFVTMDLIEGTDLRHMLRLVGSLQPADAVEVVARIGSALDAAHERGLVHRDVKPSNILVAASGSDVGEAIHSGQVYLTDFGLAKQVDSEVKITVTGAFVGTIDYVAPEQIQGERLDARTDVYALGCVLFELISGSAPYTSFDEKAAKLYAHLREPVPSLGEQVPGAPPALDEVIARAMAKLPEDRFASAGDLARAAEAALGAEPTPEVGNVATGAAAPLTVAASPAVAAPPTVVAPPTVAARPSLPETQPAIEPAVEPPAGGRRRPGPALLGALALAGIAALVAVVVVSGGDPEQGSVGEGDPSVTIGEPIRVAGTPVGIAVDEERVWVAARNGDQLVELDPTTGELSDRVGAGLEAPEGMAIGRGSLWVALGGDDSIGRVELADPASPQAVAVGDAPRDVALATREVWVTNGGDDSVSMVDPGRGKELVEIGVGRAPHGIAIGEGFVWVANRDADSVTRIDPAARKVEGEPIAVGDNPKGIAIDSGTVWVANTGAEGADDGTLTPIDAATATAREPIALGGDPRGVASGLGAVWVANGAGYVSRIEPSSGEVERIEVGSSPEELAIAGDVLWVSDGAGNQVFRIEP